MGDSGPESNNPLSPYYASETPSVPGDGRKWFAILMLLMFLLSAVFSVLGYFL
jgi:hypothetical protein